MGNGLSTKTTEGSQTESVRDRVLNTARELFYREGARAVGVDRVVAESGVAKTSLYRWFPSKDVLIAAVIEQEALDRWAGWDRNLQRAAGNPRDQLRAQFTGLARYISGQQFRGCPFLNVTVEFADPEHPARKVAREMSAELRRRLKGLIDQLEDVRNPEELADQLLMLIDGALSSVHCLGKDAPLKYLVTAADALIAAQSTRKA